MSMYLQRFKKNGAIFLGRQPADCVESVTVNSTPEMNSLVNKIGVGGTIFVYRSIKPDLKKDQSVTRVVLFSTMQGILEHLRKEGSTWKVPMTEHEFRGAAEALFKSPFSQHFAHDTTGIDGWHPPDSDFISYFAATVR